MLEKTLESSLDCKELQPVRAQAHQPLYSTNKSFLDPGHVDAYEAGMPSCSSLSDKGCLVLGTKSGQRAEQESRRAAGRRKTPASSSPLFVSKDLGPGPRG